MNLDLVRVNNNNGVRCFMVQCLSFDRKRGQLIGSVGRVYCTELV